MIKYKLIYFKYECSTDIKLKHCLKVYKEHNVIKMWRGEEKLVNKMCQHKNVILSRRVDNVWNFLCAQKHIVTLIGVKIKDDEYVEQVVLQELDRVINFDTKYTTMFL